MLREGHAPTGKTHPWGPGWTLGPDPCSSPSRGASGVVVRSRGRPAPELASPSSAGGSRRQVSSSERSCASPGVVTRGEQPARFGTALQGENDRLNTGEGQGLSGCWGSQSCPQTFRESRGGSGNLLRGTPVLGSCGQRRLSSRNDRAATPSLFSPL